MYRCRKKFYKSILALQVINMDIVNTLGLILTKLAVITTKTKFEKYFHSAELYWLAPPQRFINCHVKQIFWVRMSKATNEK